MNKSDYVDALEKQLSDLQMANDMNTSSRIRKIPPAVPPKKKAQPQVPRSALVNTVCEPSYSMKISPVLNQSTLPYNNTHPNHIRPEYANVSNISPTWKPKLQPPSKSYNVTYSNIPAHRSADDDLPPPPLPPPPSLHITPSKSFENNNTNEDFLPPPSSPVSSNYSELARATANINFDHDKQTYPHIYQNEFPDYGTSQASTYESLYEPIDPRPNSNLSTHTNNSVQSYKNNVSPGKSPLPKEKEVDALTDLLVQSISDSQDLDVFGTCIKCNKKVVGENSGCSAMGNMYHVKCFSCHRCDMNLQGKPFYAVDGLAYCEADYYETLEKCSVCYKPILDRILRATGKPYHPACFTCVECGISLDGIPFTVDAMNQIHCIDDFHKKFAPRCCVCNYPIMPEDGEEETVRVVALDRSFHVKCYRCEDCGMLLSSEAEGRGCYPLDNHILCKTCNGHRIRMLTTDVMTTDL
ncbi:hypothetical protein O0L34_g7805 [Tuta absoluta]|nr:hypothetical protein O0L34_g7805 [Tuta absoluta]